MHIHYLKHVPFEGLGGMAIMLSAKSCELTYTCMYEDQSFPSIHDLDALIVMGGPMGVHDEDEYPWLTLEKEFIESVMERDVPVLGVCLGAQLIAEVLGAAVSKNGHEEIGWFPVKRTKGLQDERVKNIPTSFNALHWHRDTFDIPSGANNFIVSEACANQAFVYGESVLGLQFHLEMLPLNVEELYQKCGNSNKKGTFIQSLDEMLTPTENFQYANEILEELLEAFIFRKLAP